MLGIEEEPAAELHPVPLNGALKPRRRPVEPLRPGRRLPARCDLHDHPPIWPRVVRPEHQLDVRVPMLRIALAAIHRLRLATRLHVPHIPGDLAALVDPPPLPSFLPPRAHL